MNEHMNDCHCLWFIAEVSFFHCQIVDVSVHFPFVLSTLVESEGQLTIFIEFGNRILE